MVMGMRMATRQSWRVGVLLYWACTGNGMAMLSGDLSEPPTTPPIYTIEDAVPAPPAPSIYTIEDTPTPSSLPSAPAPIRSTQDDDAARLTATQTEWLSGLASWYSDKFHGRRTASGEPYLRHGWTVAHRQWPLGAKIAIRNPANGIHVIATVNDRGPFHGNRLIDVSFAVAEALGIVQQGVAAVEVTLLKDQNATVSQLKPGATLSIKPPSIWPPKPKFRPKPAPKPRKR